MSASLVGSEMCIRDRLKREHAHAYGRARTRTHARTHARAYACAQGSRQPAPPHSHTTATARALSGPTPLRPTPASIINVRVVNRGHCHRQCLIAAPSRLQAQLFRHT
eukprot:11683022-Alexandrium_andersonii.AAC.1